MSRWASLRGRAEGTGISVDLSDEINLLGEMLGEVVREEAGERIFELVEELRGLCKRAAAEDTPAYWDQAAARIADMSLEQITWVLRAFTVFFHLANQAEQQEIVRVNRSRAGGPGRVGGRPESIDEAIGRMRESGIALEALLRLLNGLDIQPTLTAHPTEARRRSILDKQRKIASLLTLLDRSPTFDEESDALEELYGQISLLVGTDEVRAERPSVQEEVDQGLYFLQGTIWEMVPLIHADIRRALRRHYGQAEQIEPILRYRSWIGGDRDGNPNVTSEVTRNTLRSQRQIALRKHLEELRVLLGELSISDRRVEVPEALTRSIAADAGDVSLDENQQRIYRHEPFRLKVVCMMARLEQLIAEPEGGEGPRSGYGHKRYQADLDLLDRTLRTAGFNSVAEYGRLARARMLSQCFGFHLATLDIRQHSQVHEAAVTDILRRAGVTADYAALGEDDRVELLSAELRDSRP
ncbi:MAG TPA: phosphoenolpyruvate carboxylase, partial [Longimicrobiaceae bacterium]|nr:phosphoenolpyruvate carboxylase [Longimicrobiaceae bacterium]